MMLNVVAIHFIVLLAVLHLPRPWLSATMSCEAYGHSLKEWLLLLLKSIDMLVTSYHNLDYSNLLPQKWRYSVMNESFEQFNCDTTHRMQAIFSSIFVLQNRMQTAGEKLQTKISMKQWLLLAMTACCPEPRTLTNIGNLMGCSRQNVKKLALALEKKGFVHLQLSSNNSVLVELTEDVQHYAEEIGERQMKALSLLFSDFSEEEIGQLFFLYSKLYTGLERVENYAEEVG